MARSQKKVNHLQLMNKPLLVIFLLIAYTSSLCPANYQLHSLHTDILTLGIEEPISNSPAVNQDIYSRNFKTPFPQQPSVALTIQDIKVKISALTLFNVKVVEATQNLVKIEFQKQEPMIWINIRILFIATARNDLMFGSVSVDLQSLKGDRVITRTQLPERKLDSKTAIVRSFLNGFSINKMISIQFSMTRQRLTQDNELQVQIITGPSFDLKKIWYSYIIFSPATASFTTQGRTYQQIQFKGQITLDIMDLIQHSTNKIIGISLLNLVVSNSTVLDLKTGITDDFVLYLSTQSFIEKISLNYVIIGLTPKQVCSSCSQKMAFMEQCVSECPMGTYRQRFSRRTGYGCRRCSQKLNLELNDRGTGCKCTSDSIYKSGKCEKVVIKSFNQTKTQSNKQIEQIYKISELSQVNNCSHVKNTYWTGYRCACKIGFIPLATGCQSFQIYVRSLTYSTSLYPTQQSQASKTEAAVQNPCSILELKINGTCKCKQNYYKGPENECLECPPNSLYNNITRKCVCERGFKLDEITNDCVVDCPVNMVLNFKTKECICRSGFGFVNGVCLECLQRDGGFLAFGKCFYCPGNTVFLGTTCGCPKGQIQEPNNICRSCQLYQTPYNNTCACFYPYIRNSYTRVCEKRCSIKQIKVLGQCINCPVHSYNQGNNICTCERGFVLVERVCVPFNRSCVDGQYKMNGICVPCKDQNCQKCDSFGQCTVCISNYELGPDYQCRSICGDGRVKNSQEDCDDGNRYSGDGCDQNCKKQPGYQCFGQPTFCLSICGNGMVTRYEKCDDGNKIDGDGCSKKCSIEDGYSCFGNPSKCIPYGVPVD